MYRYITMFSCTVVCLLSQLYPDAEQAFMQVLKLDKNCEDAMHELIRVRTCQLTEMGFTPEQASRALQQFGSVQLALDSLLAGFGKTKTSPSCVSEHAAEHDNIYMYFSGRLGKRNIRVR